jgi:sugar phosphate isomerase/epimerase
VGIRLGCHLWSFGGCTVAEAAAITRALGLGCLDLGNGRDLDPAYIAAHRREEADRFKRIGDQAGIEFIDCFPQVSQDGMPFTNNHPDGTQRERCRDIWRGFFPFASDIGLSGVTLSPGRYWEGEPAQAGFDRAAEELRWAVAEGYRHGIAVRIEPHIESVTWCPELVLAMLDAVPGLTITLDHSHFIFHGLPYEQIAVLHPYASHWHARQARSGEAQSRGPAGQIDFARIIQDLQLRGYSGVVCLEYVHGAWLQQDRVDTLTETVALRDELRAYLAEKAPLA